MLSLLQILSAFAGASSTMQTAINSTLGKAAGHPLVAAWIGYLVAICFLTVLALILAFVASPRSELFKFKRRPAYYELLGGACGVFFLAVALNAAPAMGVAVFFALLVAGQLTSSLMMDRVGFLDFKALPIGWFNVVCVAVALLGAALSSFDELSHLSQPHAFVPSNSGGSIDEDLFEPAIVPKGGQPLVLHSPSSAPSAGGASGSGNGNGSGYSTLLLASGSVAAGMLAPVQASLNTRLSSLLPHKVQGVVVSLLVSIAITTILLLYIFSSNQGLFSSVLENIYSRSFPWQYTGGLFMAAVICCAVFIPASIGASQFYTFLLCGELLASLLFDSAGMFGLEKRPPTVLKVFAILAVIAASLGQGGLIKPRDIGCGFLEPGAAGNAALIVPDGNCEEEDDKRVPDAAASSGNSCTFTSSLAKGPLPTIHERSGHNLRTESNASGADLDADSPVSVPVAGGESSGAASTSTSTGTRAMMTAKSKDSDGGGESA